jgi:glucokinase
MTGWRLVADVGGTNVRFSLADASGGLQHLKIWRLVDFSSFGDALRAYLRETDLAECDGVAIGAAGPVDDGRVKLTNAPWVIDASDASAACGGAPVILVNDLEAAAMALPFLEAAAFQPLGAGDLSPPPRPARRLAVNVGTGFGAATLVPVGETWMTCPSEAGHMSLPPVLSASVAPGRRLSVEDVLSGRGVVALYRQCGGTLELDAKSIFETVRTDPASARTCEIFTESLGAAAGDLALATAAWGGVYLFGSVVSGWAGVADTTAFRTAFEDKGAMAARMHGVPTMLVTCADPALIGLARFPLSVGEHRLQPVSSPV